MFYLSGLILFLYGIVNIAVGESILLNALLIFMGLVLFVFELITE